MTDPHPLDDPHRKARVVRALLLAAPAVFVMCYLLAWVQGAELRHALLIAGVGAGMALAAALAIHVLGSRSWIALAAVKVALLLVTRR